MTTRRGGDIANDTSELWKLSGMGFEFFGSIVGGGLIGWLIDKVAGTGQRWLLIGLVVGIIVGGLNFTRRAIAMNRRAMEAYRSRREQREAPSNGSEARKRPTAGADWFGRTQHDVDQEGEDDDDEQFKPPPDFDEF